MTKERIAGERIGVERSGGEREMKIEVHHITRVEGHGNIVLDVSGGKIKKLQWQVPEAPRFFESMIRGQDYINMSHLVSRICGICSIGHSLASLKATESAIGIEISEQTGALRRLAINAENMQSHILHIGYLAAPDFFGAKSVVPLLGTKHRETVLKVIKLHRLANEMSDLVCGRTVHPINMVPGGFTSYPKERALKDMHARLADGLPALKEIAAAIKSVSGNIPDFSRETEYIALSYEKEYALYDGVLTSSDTGKHKGDYLEMMKEYVVPHSTAKFARHNRESYMVGALARFNINSGKMNDAGKEIALAVGLKAPCYNPFFNTVAQAAEVAHNMQDSMEAIDWLLGNGIKEEHRKHIPLKPCRGIGLVEVPRGLLIHDYSYDGNGRCTGGNMIIPTNQNHANIQKDMEALVPRMLNENKPKEEIELALEMLVRAYDPCISCSTH